MYKPSSEDLLNWAADHGWHITNDHKIIDPTGERHIISMRDGLYIKLLKEYRYSEQLESYLKDSGQNNFDNASELKTSFEKHVKAASLQLESYQQIINCNLENGWRIDQLPFYEKGIKYTQDLLVSPEGDAYPYKIEEPSLYEGQPLLLKLKVLFDKWNKVKNTLFRKGWEYNLNKKCWYNRNESESESPICITKSIYQIPNESFLQRRGINIIDISVSDDYIEKLNLVKKFVEEIGNIDTAKKYLEAWELINVNIKK